MADPSIFAVGAAATATSDTLSVPAPAGTLTGKVLVAFFSGTPDAADGDATATAANWTEIFTGSHADLHASAYWARADTVGAGPYSFVFPSADNFLGVIVAVSDALASGDVLGIGPGAYGHGASTATMTATSVTPPSDRNGVFWFGASYGDSATTASGYSGTGPTLTECFDGAAAGASGSLHIAFGVQATAGATGSRTGTLSASELEYVAAMFSLKPADVVSSDASPRGYRSIPPCYRP